MILSSRLKSALRATIAYKPQSTHTSKSVKYSIRNLTSTTSTARRRPRPLTLTQPSPLSYLSYTTAMNSSNTSTPQPSKTETNTKPESSHPALPALPPAEDASQTLEVGGAALRLDHLGPLVVNEDGTMSRIANWDKMIDIEKENTLRVLGKRNQMRLAKLRAAKAESVKSKNEPQKGEHSNS